ncbi:hypothetical protein V8E54_009119 [Elaphomyces granulatus]
MSSLRVRKRANTRTLLGDAYVEVVKDSEILPPPRPLQNASDYISNTEHLKKALKYADCTLRNQGRKLSPIGQHALALYKDACARLLDLEEGEVFEDRPEELEVVKGEWVAAIRTYEQSIQYVACLNITRTLDAQTLQDEILSLQRTSFYARYGDYMAHTCQELKRAAEAAKVLGWEKLQKSYWTEIGQQLRAEQDAFKRCLDGEMVHGQCPTTIAVTQACTRIGLNFMDTLASIHHYAVRNELVHSNLLSLVKEGDFWALAKRLHDDYCDVPRLATCINDSTSGLMLTLIESIINIWFDRNRKEPEKYGLWKSKKTLEDLYEELKGSCDDDADINKRVSHEISQAVKKSRRDMEKMTRLDEMLSRSRWNKEFV